MSFLFESCNIKFGGINSFEQRKRIKTLTEVFVRSEKFKNGFFRRHQIQLKFGAAFIGLLNFMNYITIQHGSEFVIDANQNKHYALLRID